MHKHLHRKEGMRVAAMLLGLFAIVGLTANVAHAGIASIDISGKFIPLVGLPGLPTDMSSTNLPQYINALYMLLIGGGALIAVIQIMIGGVQYSMSDKLTSKSGARERIQATLFGLALLLIPVIVLNTINPNLTNLDVLNGMGKLDTSSTGGAGSSVAGNGAQQAQQNQISDCNSKANSQWDSYCNTCILKTETMGSSCNYTAPATVTACGSFNLGSLPAGTTCESFCTGTIKGTYSAANSTCSYGGGPIK